jgi:hypothetical protein
MDGLSFFETNYRTGYILALIGWACLVIPLAARSLLGWVATGLLTAVAAVAIWYHLDDNHNWLADAPVVYGLSLLSAIAAVRLVVLGARRVVRSCRGRPRSPGRA